MLPGLGADHRLFIPQLKAIEQTSVPAWLDPQRDPHSHQPETITHYAARYARHLHDHGTLESPYALVGFSFGGQMTLEIARHLLTDQSDISLPTAIVLISAPRTSDAITERFRKQQRMARYIPNTVMRLGLRLIAPRFARMHDLDARWTRILKDMARDVDLPMLRWGARAAAEWAFTERDAQRIQSSGIPIHQIHAEEDPIIPYIARHADATIAGKAHLLAWTHADMVNEFILQAVA